MKLTIKELRKMIKEQMEELKCKLCGTEPRYEILPICQKCLVKLDEYLKAHPEVVKDFTFGKR